MYIFSGENERIYLAAWETFPVDRYQSKTWYFFSFKTSVRADPGFPIRGASPRGEGRGEGEGWSWATTSDASPFWLKCRQNFFIKNLVRLGEVEIGIFLYVDPPLLSFLQPYI